MRVRAAAMLVFVAAATTAPAWGATYDPTHAQADARAAIHDHGYPFCSDPHEPLSSEALELCDHASAVPGCGGFATACAKAMAARTPPWSPWWSRLSLPPFLGLLAQGAVWLLVALVVLAVLIPIVRGLAGTSRAVPKAAEKKAPATPAPAVAVLAEIASMTDEEQILARARELAASGDLAAALQLYLLASLRSLDKRGAVRLTKDRTNGEYVRACADAQAKPALRDIVREVDRVQFGGLAPSVEGVQRAADRAMAIVRLLPVATLMLALVLACTGCGSVSLPKPHRTGDDPAGYELLHDVMAKQGVTVSGLQSSLATLPLPSPGEHAPAVIVDLANTALDDDSKEHLVAWVEAGGVLVLAGFPEAWPKALGASRVMSTGAKTITARRLLARAIPSTPGEDDEEDDASGDDEPAIYAHEEEHGTLVTSSGLKMSGAPERIAWYADATPYALSIARGAGYVIGLADDELLTNVGIARPTNAAALVAILASTSRSELHLADADDGVSPPSSPIAALLRAGLGLPLAHACVFALVLFLASGTRLRRPTPASPPRRRAFTEHVEAVGALYARARSAPHALAAYARFADERLRLRLPRGSNDIAAFLASRSHMPQDVCQRLWARAMQAKAGAPALGDELSVLRELTALYAAATAQDR